MAGTWKKFSTFCKAGVGIVTRVIVGLIVAQLLMVLYSLCWIRVQITARIYYYKNKSLLSREGVLPMADINHEESIMNGVILLKDDLSLDAMKELLLSKFFNAKDSNNRPQFPRFTQYFHLSAGYLMWSEESNFNIDDHIKLFRGQSPNDEGQLKLLITDLCHRPLPSFKSCWEIVVIPLEYSQSDVPKTCVIFRVHHCMGDGMSMMRMLFEQLAGHHGAFQHVLKRMHNKFKPRFKNAFLNMFGNLAWVVYRFDIKSFISQQQTNHVFVKDKSKYCKLSNTRYLDWTYFRRMDTIRHIRDATSTGVNDVIMSCMAGAFRKYFLKHDLCPPDFLKTALPLSFHGPNDPVQMINKGCGAVISIPTGDMDCLQRLKATTVEIDRLKNSTDIITSHFFMQYWANTLPYTLTTQMFKYAKFNVAYTSIPGPSIKNATFNGNPIESIVAILLPSRQAEFGVSIATYSGAMTVAVSVDKARVSSREDVHQLLDDFVEEVQQLYNSVISSPNKPPSTAMEKKMD